MNTQETLEKIEVWMTALSQKLGVASEFLLEAGIRYYIADGISGLVVSISTLVGIFIVIRFFYKQTKIKHQSSFFEEEAYAVAFFMSTVIGFLISIFFLGYIRDSVVKIIAPEWSMIKEIVK